MYRYPFVLSDTCCLSAWLHFPAFSMPVLAMLQFSKPIAVLQLLYLSPVYIRKLYIHIVPIPAGILIHHDILYILQSHILPSK